MNHSPSSREARQLQQYKLMRLRAAARASGTMPVCPGIPGALKTLVRTFQSFRRVGRKVMRMAILMAVCHQAHAQSSGTWTNATSGGLWSNGGNWSLGTVADGSGNTADFATLDLGATNTVHLDSSRTIGTILFGDTNTGSAASWNLSNNGVAANVLTVSAIEVGPSGTGASNSISAVVGGTNVSMLARVATGGILNLTNSNNFTGSFLLGTTGGGNRTWLPTLNLNAPGGNAISGSMLQIGSGNYHQGGTVNLLASNQINDNAILNLRVAHYSGSSTFRMNGFNETIGGLTSNQVGGGGSLAIVENGAATPSTLTINLTSGTQTFGTGETGRNKLRMRDGGAGVLNLVKSGAGTQIIGAPSGGGETLRNWITYTGTTAVDGGTLLLRNNTGFASAVTIASGATFELQNTTGTVMTHNPDIAGAGGLTKSGAGVVQTNGNLSYTGATTITGGTLRLLSPGALPTGATVHVDASALTAGAITTWTNNGTLGAGANLTGGGTVIAGGSKFNNNVVRFNGSQDLRTTGFNYGVSGTNSTVAYVGAMDGTDNERLVSAINNWLLGYWGGTKDAAHFVNGWVAQGPATDTLGHMYIGTVDSANSGIAYGDFLQIGGPTASRLGPQGLVLGGWGNNTERSQGTVGEVIIYNSVLSATDRANLEAYLWRKWYGSATDGLLPSATDVNITASGATLDINGNNQTIASLTGVAGSSVMLGSGTLTVGKATGSTTFAGTISGTGALIKTGASTLTLSGANNYNGGTTSSGGTIIASNSGAFGIGTITMNGGTLNTGVNLSNDIILNNVAGNTLAPNGNYRLLSGQISGTGGFTLASGGGTPGLELNNSANNFAGDVTINSGTFLRLTNSEVLPNTASVANNGNLRLDVTGGGTETISGLTGSGSVWIPTSNSSLHTLVVGANDATSNYGGTIGASGQNNAFLALQKIGNGTLTLSGANSYTGGTTVNAGTLSLTGSLAAQTIAINGGALAIASNNFNSLGTPSGSITIAAGATMTANNTTNNAHNLGVVNLNGGTLTSINGPAGVANDGGFGNWLFRGVTVGGSSVSTISSSTFAIVSGDFAVNDSVTGPATDLLVSSRIISGSLTKQGVGTMELTGANTYSGATFISQGKLVLNGSIIPASGSSSLTVASGASLGGVGTLGSATNSVNLTIQSGGILAPGKSPGVLTLFGTTVLAPGSSLDMEVNIGGVTAPGNGTTGTDLLAINGTIDLTGALLTGTYGGGSNNLYQGDLNALMMTWIINNDLSESITGTFANTTLSPGLTSLFGAPAYFGTLGGQPVAVFYNSQFGVANAGGLTGGNDVLLIAIPEPSRALMAPFALLPVLLWRRRRC